MNKDICQFYVVVGDNSFIAPVDNNVYINATNVDDYKLIQDKIFKLYKEKAKLGVVVGGEIIFLVGGISDSEKANDIMSKLRLNGKVQIIKKEKKKALKEEIIEIPNIEKEKVIEKEEKVVPPPIRENFEVSENVGVDLSITKDKKDINEEVNKQPDNVYKRDFESNNYNGYIGKPTYKKDKVGKWPLILFIISLLLFIGSVILLFVL